LVVVGGGKRRDPGWCAALLVVLAAARDPVWKRELEKSFNVMNSFSCVMVLQ
jgi:hypothetical protein